MSVCLCVCLCVQSSCMKLYDWLKVAPYQVDDQSAADDDDDFSAAKGLRVLTVAYSTERFVVLHKFNFILFSAVVPGFKRGPGRPRSVG